VDFSTVIIVVIGFVVLAAIGSVLWWVAIIWFGVKAWQTVSKQLDAEAIHLNRLIAQAAAASGAQRKNLEGVISQKMMNFQRQMSDLDNLHRQRYELKASELQNYAASNGVLIDLPKY